MTSKLLQEFSTPFYLYDEEVIQNKVLFLNSLDFKFDFKFHFAVKANPNLAILNLIKNITLVLRLYQQENYLNHLKLALIQQVLFLMALARLNLT